MGETVPKRLELVFLHNDLQTGAETLDRSRGYTEIVGQRDTQKEDCWPIDLDNGLVSQLEYHSTSGAKKNRQQQGSNLRAQRA